MHKRDYGLSPRDFLLARITRKHECWIWTGPIVDKNRASNRRYGAWRCSQMKEKFAHRAAYRMFKGEIPDGLLVLHECDTPLCVNPGHLFLGTSATNNLDRDQKGRLNVLLGNKHGRSTITEAQARQVKSLLQSFPKKYGRYPAIAKHLGISVNIVLQISTGKTWVHV